MRPVSCFFDQHYVKQSQKSTENVQENFSPEVAMKTAPAERFMWSGDFLTTYLFASNNSHKNFLPILSRNYFCDQNLTLKTSVQIFVVDLVNGPH